MAACGWRTRSKLAGYVLDGQEGWGDDEIREAIAPADAGPRRFRRPRWILEQPLPVYILYLTAFMRDRELQLPQGPLRQGPPRPSRALGKPLSAAERSARSSRSSAKASRAARTAARSALLAQAAAVLRVTEHTHGPGRDGRAGDPHDTVAALPDSAAARSYLPAPGTGPGLLRAEVQGRGEPLPGARACS